MATIASSGAPRNRRLRLASGAILLPLLISCGGGGGQGDPAVAEVAEAEQRAPGPDDLDIARLAYSAEQRTPPDFYREADRYPDRSVFRFHVDNEDVAALRDGLEPAYELCTDEFSQALRWSEEASVYRQLPSTMSDSVATDWYYQFDRAMDVDPPAMVVTRIFRCEALDRTGRAVEGYAGRLNRAQPTAADLEFVAEYLWQFSVYNNALHAVVSSEGSMRDGDLVHVITRVEVVAGGGSGCDRIELWNWEYQLDGPSGDLYAEQVFVRAFDARREGGIVSLCGN
jgi:hypothetical protein